MVHNIYRSDVLIVQKGNIEKKKLYCGVASLSDAVADDALVQFLIPQLAATLPI